MEEVWEGGCPMWCVEDTVPEAESESTIPWDKEDEIKLLLGTEEPEGQEVTISRAALQGLSPVFHNMLTHNMAERNQRKVRLEHVSMEAWDVISALYFSGRNLLYMDNVHDMVRVADLYDLTMLKDKCDVYLCKNLDVMDDQVDVLNWADTYRLSKLKEKLLNAARKNFESFSQSRSFSILNGEVLMEILCGPFTVADEHTVCLAVLRWLQAQNADRQTVETLFQGLKLNEVCLSCLEKHVKECENAVVRDVVLELMEEERQNRKKDLPDRIPLQYFAQVTSSGYINHCFPNKMGHLLDLKCKCAWVEWDFSFLAVETKCHRYDWQVRSLTYYGAFRFLTSVKTSALFRQSAACIFKDFLVMIDSRCRGRTAFYNLKTKVWSKGPVMPTGPCAVVSVDDTLYMLQESLFVDVPSIIEVKRYSSDGQEWQLAGYLENAVSHLNTAAAGNYILALIKVDDLSTQLQCFNTKTNTASILEGFSGEIDSCKAFSFGEKGAIFASMNELTCVYPKGDGQFSISKHQLPDLTNFFATEGRSCTVTETMHDKQQISWMKELTAKEHTDAYLVQHGLDGKRVSLTHVPSLSISQMFELHFFRP